MGASSGSIEDIDSEMEIKNDEEKSRKLRNNYVHKNNLTRIQQPNPPMSRSNDKLQEPPKPVEFRHQGILEKQQLKASNVIDMKSIKPIKYGSRIGGGGILSHVV